MEMSLEHINHIMAGDSDYLEGLELDILQNAKCSDDGSSLLTCAVIYNQLYCCEVICRRCPQLVYDTNRHGETALHWAAREGFHLLAKLMLDASPSNKVLGMVNRQRETALHWAVKHLQFETVKVLVEADPHYEYSADKFDGTPFLIAFKKALYGVDYDKKAAVTIKRFLIQYQHAQYSLLTVNEKWTLLHDAVYNGDLEAIKDINSCWPDSFGLVDKEGQNVIHLAVLLGKAEVVKCVLDLKSIDDSVLNAQDKKGNTPLHVGLASDNHNIATTYLLGDSRIAKMVKNMEEKTALEMIAVGNTEWSLLHYPAQKGNIIAIKEFFKYVPNCWDGVNKENQNFLHVAAMYDKIEVVEYSLELTTFTNNVLNGKDIHGNTPLHIAISCEHDGTASALIQDPRVDKTVENKDGKIAQNMGPSVLFQCASKGDIDFFRSIKVDMLRKSRDEDGESVLSIAAREGYLDCCEVIFKRCPKLLYKQNKDGLSALHLASGNGKCEIVQYLLGAWVEMIQQDLGELQIDFSGELQIDSSGELQIHYDLLKMVSKNGRTALHFAVGNGDLRSAKFLIKADARKKLLGIRDDRQETALHYAVKNQNFEIVKLLVEADPDFVYSANDSGNTPLSLAMQEVLLDNPLSPSKGKIRSLLIQKQRNQCMHQDGNGQTVLHHTTNNKNLVAIKEIIEFCNECSELVDSNGENFFHVAARVGNKEIVEYILTNKDISYKVLNEKNHKDETPLHIAISSGNQNVALLLLYEHRVNNWIMDKQGNFVLKSIKFNYDRRRAGVYGLMDEKELKDQSDFDLLVGALISTVAFTAGITVPGGFISDGPNRGKAILHRNRSFEAFVLSNTIALALSLFAVFTHFCMKSLDEKETAIQLKVAKFCSIGSIYALMIAFVMGSFSVLSISLGLAIGVSVICCCFFGCSFYSLWRMRRNRQKYRPSI